MSRVIMVQNKRIPIIEVEEDDICELCGKKDELRPYGPNCERICFECGEKDKKMTEKRMNQILFGENYDA